MQGYGLAGHGIDAALRRGARVLEDYKMKRGILFGVMILGAMLAFELFNYSTTDFALTNLLGDLRFMGLRWGMILAIAFCGIDFAGIARLFSPTKDRGERTETWYLLAAWFLAATMNAMLTWWGVSLALLDHSSLGNEILSRATLLSVVPVFVAVLVWVIRTLLIGMLSMAGDRLFVRVEDSLRSATQVERGPGAVQHRDSHQPAKVAHMPTAAWAGSGSNSVRPARMVGADDERTERGELTRARTLAEKHGYSRAPQPASRPTPPPMSAVVRPAPKPNAQAANVGSTGNGGQPALQRQPVPVGAGNGSGNGHSGHHDFDED